MHAVCSRFLAKSMQVAEVGLASLNCDRQWTIQENPQLIVNKRSIIGWSHTKQPVIELPVMWMAVWWPRCKKSMFLTEGQL